MLGKMVKIQMQRLGEPTPIHPGTIEELKKIPNLNVEKVAILEAGMQKGGTSMFIVMKDKNDVPYFAEMSADMWDTINSARKGVETYWAENDNPYLKDPREN
jgi:hypothetical protein